MGPWKQLGQMGERACSRKQSVSRHMYRLAHRIREQARSHILISDWRDNLCAIWRAAHPSLPTTG
ncbi:hypothetical protein DCC84_04780 [Pseudomonas sp. SXM-1]|nr:hypothetical protein DCC84_04780 [Pseudomonas sp. SXM-1]